MMRVWRESLCWALAMLMFVYPAGGLALWGSAAEGAEPVDQSYITPTAILAAAVHPRRVLTAPDMEMMPLEVLSAAGIQQTGVDPLDIESALLVVQPPEAGPPAFGLVLRLAKPYALNAIKLPGNIPLADGQLLGRPLRQAPNPMLPSLYMPDDRTLMLGTESMLTAMLNNQKNPVAGPLSKIVAKTGLNGDLTAVVVLEPIRPMLVGELAQVPFPPPFAGAKRLPELIDAAKIDLSLLENPQASLALLAPSEAAAQELETVIRQLLDTGQQMILTQLANQMTGDDPVEQAGAQYAERITKRMFALFQPQRKGNLLTISQEGGAANQTAVIGVLVALLLPAVQSAREAARRMQSSNNLKQIALAMHNYHDTYRTFPARASFSPEGKPLLSWRVHILPFLEQQTLYEQFHLDEPWDSPHNKTLLAQMPDVYQNPSAKPLPGRASYLVPTGKGSIFEGTKGVSIGKILDGTSNTILAVEANEEASVPWTQPVDLEYNANNPLLGLGKAHPGGFSVAMADGSVRFIAATVDPQLFLQLLMMADRKPVGQF